MPYLVANKQPGEIKLRDGTGHHMPTRTVGYEPVPFMFRPVIDPQKQSCEEVDTKDLPKGDAARLQRELKNCQEDLVVAQFMRTQGDKDPINRILNKIRADRPKALALHRAYSRAHVEAAQIEAAAKAELAKIEAAEAKAGNEGSE